MRFKNLTITLTLMCLSIIALAGLVLLPITNVICEVDEYGWTESNGGIAANYYAKKDVSNESWYLVANVDAKGVSASGSVGILTKDYYTESQDTIMGTAELTAKRGAYIWFHKYLVLFRCNNKGTPHDYLGYDANCMGHVEPVEADSNIAGAEGFKPFYDFTDIDGNPVPRHTNIALKVKVREPKYKILTGRTERTKKSVTSEVGADYQFLKGRVMGTYEDEEVKEWKISEERTRERAINEAETSGHSVSVSPEKKADCDASASVSFGGASDSKTVSYIGEP